jgi:hypothetical protein
MVPIILDGPVWPTAAPTSSVSSSALAGRRDDYGERGSVKGALSRGVRLRGREWKGSIDSTTSSFSKASSSAYTASIGASSRTSSMAMTSRTSFSTINTSNTATTKRSISRRDAGPPLIVSPQPSPRASASSQSRMRQNKPKSVDVMEVDLKQFHCNPTQALDAPSHGKAKKKSAQRGKNGRERKEGDGSPKDTGKGSRKSVLGFWWQKRSA